MFALRCGFVDKPRMLTSSGGHRCTVLLLMAQAVKIRPDVFAGEALGQQNRSAMAPFRRANSRRWWPRCRVGYAKAAPHGRAKLIRSANSREC
ncbi:hypothetical protein T02_11583 [Trichinella nativa]|uniref:Uncharacterized protein n=1 Tax=Trichinella nativa TaxID=6335 RepID=A0A0V1L1V8_9BILA|nr:hypothetical protein T02_11583 [Trichinella nativa]